MSLFPEFDHSERSDSARHGRISMASWSLLGRIRDAMGPMIDIVVRTHPWRLECAPVTIPGGRTFSAARLLTYTTKMDCWSWSLPAGHPARGGTCSASIFRSPADPENAAYLCDFCYSGKNNYLYYEVTFAQKLRLEWVKRSFDEFAETLTEAVPREPFFRIHDSGDFFHPDYYRAWVKICQRRPDVLFWAPTRQHVFPRWRALFKECPPPSNLVIRPSALMFGAEPPKIGGLAAGSTAGDSAPPGVKSCPAYESKGHSCTSAGCRSCWTDPMQAVSYKSH